ncbi:glycine/sarcosine/betaine reductase component B subunit [Oribacterium parvum]|uniref:glycine/sarcosine/betaine reductase component B subunit n=1 Tax=Oribacterium parvum TaxID=1501329 RepID=UPI0028DC2D0B|nr:glycine/sarcosine/betaine reductase component B subunit [Oribacterium parvum]
MGIGPSTKETTLHHFRDPLVDELCDDTDIDFTGVIVAGIPQDNVNKYFTGDRIGAWAEAMRVKGAIVSEDSWGNSNVDFAHTIEEIGKRDIAVVGISFVGVQGAFVVTNQYMNNIVDINKSAEGVETNVVGENNLVRSDAKKAKAILKLKMRSVER